MRWPLITAAVAAVAVGALVASLVRGSGDPPVIRLASGGERAAATTMEAAGDAAASDLAMWIHYEFVLTDGARFPAGEGTAWHLEPPRDLEARIRDLASRLGVDGEVSRSPHGDSGYIVGAGDDRDEPSLWVAASGEWSYYDPTVYPVVECVMPAEPEPAVDPDTADGDTGRPDTAEGEDIGEVSLDYCEAPTPPENVPTEAEARRAAENLFAGLDLPVQPRIVDVHADEWGAWVIAAYPIGGRLSDVYLNVGFGPDAAVVSANGTLARPVEAGTYPTIDADAAVARLNDGGGWYGGPWRGGVADSTADIAVESPAVETLPAPAVDDHDAPVASDDPVMILPYPEDGEPETVTVTLVGYEPSLVMTMDVDGTWWLLPGVRFTDSDGGVWAVMTVADEYVQTDGQVDGEPEPGGGEPGQAEPGQAEPVEAPAPGPDPEPTGGQQGGGTSGSGGQDEPGQPGEAGSPEQVAHDVIGMEEKAAVAYIEEAGYRARVVARDGENFIVTDDYDQNRINLQVEQGRVVHAEVY